MAAPNGAQRAINLATPFCNIAHPDSQPPDIIAARLKEIVPEAQILVVIREQVSLLQSWYRWHGGYGQYLFLNKYIDELCEFPLSVSEWLHFQFAAPDRNIIGVLDYNDVIASYEEHFGAAQVHVLVYEQLLRAPGAYCQQLADVLGVPTAPVREALCEVFENSEANTWNSRESGEPLPGAINPHWRTRIAQRFAQSNATLAARRGLDLAGFGYALHAPDAMPAPLGHKRGICPSSSARRTFWPIAGPMVKVSGKATAAGSRIAVLL
jgi:hypothetical protein